MTTTTETHETTRQPSLAAIAAAYRRGGTRHRARAVRAAWPSLLEPDWSLVAAEAARQAAIAGERHRRRDGATVYHRRGVCCEMLRPDPLFLAAARRRATANQRRAARAADAWIGGLEAELVRRLLHCRPGNTRAARRWREILLNRGLSREIWRDELPQLAIEAAAALLTRHGWTREHRSASASLYLARGEIRLRLSGHELPDTGERRYNHSMGWACCNREVVVGRMRDLRDWHRLLAELAVINRENSE